MEKFIKPSNKFDFSLISLGSPKTIQGGAYFTNINFDSNPLYIITPKCLTKQGFIKNGKKCYTDLMFDNNDQEIIEWFENLETKCQELVYEKGDGWFNDSLEKDDIESAFTSPIRIYKSGKFYLVRVNFKINQLTNIPNVKIYDENEVQFSMDDIINISNKTQLISIIEIQGIKFTSKNFQIELEMKQSMVLNNQISFDNCLIKQNSNKEDVLEKNENLNIQTHNNNIQDDIQNNNSFEIESKNDLMNKNIVEDFENENNLTDDLKEIEFFDNIDNLELITLKKPNEVYYNLYKEARKKAKEAKINAIKSFLEAKQIKKTYMLDDLEDSDSDNDLDFDTDSYSA